MRYNVIKKVGVHLFSSADLTTALASPFLKKAKLAEFMRYELLLDGVTGLAGSCLYNCW